MVVSQPQIMTLLIEQTRATESLMELSLHEQIYQFYRTRPRGIVDLKVIDFELGLIPALFFFLKLCVPGLGTQPLWAWVSLSVTLE